MRTSSPQPAVAKGSCGGLARQCACEDCHRAVPAPLSRRAHHFGDVRVAAEAEERGGPFSPDRMPRQMGPQTEEGPERPRRGTTLSYREATEYSECLRFLGPDAVAECRQLVLGEKPPNPCDVARIVAPMSDISTFQSPGLSGWFGAKFGCFRTNCTRRHRGWDIHAATGTPIVAAVTGQVTRGHDADGWGDFIRLRSEGDRTRSFIYGHLSAREPNGRYCAGATIGATGISGNVSADRPHLHFELHVNGTAVDPGALFAEPANVVEQTGSATAVIDKTLPEPCNPCAM